MTRLALLMLAVAAALGVACARSETGPPATRVTDPPVPRACGGVAGTACGAGEYCRVPPPLFADKAGVCQARPQMCPMIFSPVCGVDRKTYPNACGAARVGAGVDHPGACEAPPPSGTAARPATGAAAEIVPR